MEKTLEAWAVRPYLPGVDALASGEVTQTPVRELPWISRIRHGGASSCSKPVDFFGRGQSDVVERRTRSLPLTTVPELRSPSTTFTRRFTNASLPRSDS